MKVDFEKLAALRPAIEHIVAQVDGGTTVFDAERKYSPWACRVTLPMPGTNPMDICLEKRYQGEWHVQSGGWSWKVESWQDLEAMRTVLSHARMIAALLESCIISD